MTRLLTLCLGLSLLLSTPLQAQQVEDYFQGLDGFTARFTQKLFNAELQLQQESSGTIQVKRPDHFRLEYSRPYSQLYVADGQRIWSFDADLEQVIVRPQEGMLHNTPAMILSNPTALRNEYQVNRHPSDDGLVWFELNPISRDGNFDEIHLAFDARQIRIMEMKDGFGQITRLEFEDLRRNPKFTADTFSFTPPKGVDVIHQ